MLKATIYSIGLSDTLVEVMVCYSQVLSYPSVDIINIHSRTSHIAPEVQLKLDRITSQKPKTLDWVVRELTATMGSPTSIITFDIPDSLALGRDKFAWGYFDDKSFTRKTHK